MRRRIFLLLVIVVIAMSFSACGKSEQKAESQATDNQAVESGSGGLEWPSQYMSTLPSPDSAISSIEKLNGTDILAIDDTTTQPSSVNVVMNEMTAKEASSYYDKIKSVGVTINTDQKDNDKILLVGTLNDADNNPFLFSYTADDNFGNVSITILKELYADGTGDATPAS